jgi:cytoskeletal protein RodZ
MHLRRCKPDIGMSNRLYTYMALGILIVAPIIVQIVSYVVPAAPQATDEAVSKPQQQPEEVAKKPVVAPQPQQAPSSDALVHTTPTLDTQGIAPTAVGAVQSAIAPPPTAPVGKPADDAEPAPRRRSTHVDQ